MKINVSCYAGHRGEETPCSFRLGKREVNVTEVVDRWLGPDHRYFKVQGDDAGTYILRHAPWTDEWELTFYTENA